MITVDLQTLAGIVVIIGSIITLTAVIWRLPESLTGNAEARRRHPCNRPLADRLDADDTVCTPAGHPEPWSDRPEAIDAALAELHNRLWPGEEYRATLTCRTPELTGYHSVAEAIEDIGPTAATYSCRCGQVHARRRKIRLTWLGGRRG
ncbi:hypothetical protein [Nonomuraea typhae]|uniref:hypothetical protein n=1 Tax=Nonomuraea typhae TaxID=2603600 RepID=UPI0012FA80F2|nr:hypothetical protein [Nonomuraea typhae]